MEGINATHWENRSVRVKVGQDWVEARKVSGKGHSTRLVGLKAEYLNKHGLIALRFLLDTVLGWYDKDGD